MALSDPWAKDGKLYGQDFHLLRSSLDSEELFLDPFFPPNRNSISYSGYLADDAAAGGKKQDIDKITWVRANDLYKDAMLVVNGTNRNDVNQGTLGNCWFLSALVGVSEVPALFARVVPKDQSFGRNYAGIFYFRFWQYGEWVEVVVDDFIPVKNGEPVFVYSDDHGEMWPCLLEKAYAKLHGSYWHLNMGLPMSAMVDFTGGFPESYVGNGNGALEGLGMDLFLEMKKAFSRPGTLVCASSLIRRYKKYGIIGGHCYTVLEIAEDRIHGIPIPRLVRIRNPWGGSMEWRGSWSDKSKEMKSLKKKQRNLLKTGEGDWWMAYTDFLRCFTHLSICHIQPEDQDNTKTDNVIWTEKSVHGSWVAGLTAGGCGNDGFSSFLTNPQYLLTIREDEKRVEVNMALMQKGRRQLRDEMGSNTFLAIGLTVFPLRKKINSKASRKDLKGITPMGMVYEEFRTTTLQTILSVGHYLVVPASFFRDQEAEFFLRVNINDKHFRLEELE